jgi:uroporphyrinogen III methyltransferase / synthase
LARGHDARALGHLRTAVIGPATARRLREFGLASDIVPASYRAESVVDAFRTQTLTGRRVLLPRASEARPVLPVELQRMGARVDEVAVYRTLTSDHNADLLLHHLANQSVDVVTFTSSSTVRNFHALLPADQREALMQGVTIASIGPVTADTAATLGYHVDIIAATYTIPGLCDAILDHYGKS